MSDETKTERLHLVLSPSELQALDKWAHTRGTKSRAEAVRALIKLGMIASETPEELRERCEAATMWGDTLGQVFASILEGHPLVRQVHINEEGLVAHLSDGQPLKYSRQAKEWTIDPF